MITVSSNASLGTQEVQTPNFDRGSDDTPTASASGSVAVTVHDREIPPRPAGSIKKGCVHKDAIPSFDEKPKHRRAHKRGLKPVDTPASVRAWIKEKEKTSVARSVVHALTTIAFIPLVAAAYCLGVYAIGTLSGSFAFTTTTAVLGYMLTIMAIARQHRAMENMVHDGSHGNWHRSSKKINDWLVDALVALPVLSSVGTYWPFHRDHHGAFGGHDDPCRRRFDAMGIYDIDLSTPWKIAVAVLRWLPEYNAEYYKEIGSLAGSVFAKFAAWHLIMFIFPITLIAFTGFEMSAINAFALSFVAWVAFWMIPFTLPLPVIRSIAEAEEHDYDRADTEFDATFTNSGFWHRMLFHPAGDAYHLIHHMYPKIPAWAHGDVHKYLMANDPKYRQSLHRTRVLETVKK